MEHQIHTLSNGLRFAYLQSENTRVSHCGIFVDVGSRDEMPTEVGVAHLLEHMLFKGTAKRNVHQVLNRLEVVGGDLNAFTTKDKTSVYASIINEELDRALELLRDVSFNSIFPEKELKKEKRVIMEEIDMYLDTPEERIFDEFMQHFYRGHALSYNILGDKQQVESLQQRDLIQFQRRGFTTSNSLIVIVSPLPFKRLAQRVEKHFSDLTLSDTRQSRTAPKDPSPFEIEKSNGFLQAHVVMGAPAYNLNHVDRPTMMLLSNLLTGPGLNSKLNLVMRERLGYTYSVESSYLAATDHGLFNIYWSTDKRNLNRSRKALNRVIDELIDKPLTESQLKKYKTQFKGQMIMAEESNLSLFFALGKSLLDLGTFDTLTEALEKVDAIRPADIQQVAQDLLTADKRSFLTYLPR